MHRASVMTVAVVALLVGACGSATSPFPPASSGANDASVGPPEASPAASLGVFESGAPAGPSAEPSGSASSTAEPSVAALAWSAPVTIPGLGDCARVSAIVDAATGTIDVAASCDGAIRSATSADGTTWSTTVLRPAPGTVDTDAFLVDEGFQLLLAYAQVPRSENGCGDSVPPSSRVFLRTFRLPGGPWSAPEQLGPVGDGLLAVTAADQQPNAIVARPNSTLAYEKSVDSGVERHRLGNLRPTAAIGLDGDSLHPLIVDRPWSSPTLHLLHGPSAEPMAIAGSDFGLDPHLAVAIGGDPVVSWTHSHREGPCGDVGVDPANGTYVATSADGVWTTTKLSPSVGESGLALDPTTRVAYAAVPDDSAVDLYAAAPGGSWTSQVVAPVGNAWFATVATDPTSPGHVVVLFVPHLETDALQVEVATGREPG